MKDMKRKYVETEDASKSKSKKSKTCNQPSTPALDLSKEISPFHLQTSSLYLPLSPISQKYPIEGICAEHLSPLLLTYYPPFNGLILSYSDPVLSETCFNDDGQTVLLKNIDEYGASWAWLTADFLVLKPEKGTWLEGVISLQNDGFLGVVCWNLFNASIERSRLPRDWKWKDACETSNFESLDKSNIQRDESSGFFVDGYGKKVEGAVKFRVADFESSQYRERGFLTIIGTMLSEKDELAHTTSEREEDKQGRFSLGGRLGGPNAIGVTKLGVTNLEVE